MNVDERVLEVSKSSGSSNRRSRKQEIKVPNLPKNERNIDYLTDGEFGSIGRNSTSSNN